MRSRRTLEVSTSVCCSQIVWVLGGLLPPLRNRLSCDFHERSVRLVELGQLCKEAAKANKISF